FYPRWWAYLRTNGLIDSPSPPRNVTLEGRMNILRAVAATALFAAAIGNWSTLRAQNAPPAASASCAPANGWNLLCGNTNPEDLVPIPGTQWLVASGMKEGSGPKLVDTNAKTA